MAALGYSRVQRLQGFKIQEPRQFAWFQGFLFTGTLEGPTFLGLLTWIPLQEHSGRFFRIQVDLGFRGFWALGLDWDSGYKPKSPVIRSLPCDSFQV